MSPTVAAAARWLAGSPATRGVLVLVLGLFVVRVLAIVVERRLAAGAHPHWALVARKAVSYGGTIVVLLWAVHLFGIDVTALVATAGVAGVAVGFAAQTSLSNLIAGIFLLIDRPFQVGDAIELEGRMGTVHEITLLSTFIRTFDNLVARWPNEVVLKATIVNYTRNPVRRLDVPVNVAYGTDLELARQVLRDTVRSLDIVLVDPPADVFTKRLLDHGVELEVRVWIEQADFLDARTQVVETTHTALATAGIEIPFPQLKVWQGAERRG